MPKGKRKYSNGELLSELQRLYDKYGKATRDIVREHGRMSSATFANRFGSFNGAKDEAGLPTFEHGGGGRWANKNGFVRTEDYYEHIQNIAECRSCGEGSPACLDFHHVGEEKEYGVGRAAGNFKAEKVYEELQKTVALCANCHRKHHDDRHDLDASKFEPRDWPKPIDIINA